MAAKRKTIAVDFDGVLHAYTSPWAGVASIPDPPVPGSMEFLAAAVERFDVVIFSVRAAERDGLHAMHRWLLDHLDVRVAQKIDVTAEKPRASIYIDDRGFEFCGSFPSLDAIDAFVPWNRRATQEVPNVAAVATRAPGNAEAPGVASVRERALLAVNDQCLVGYDVPSAEDVLAAIEGAGLVVVDITEDVLDAVESAGLRVVAAPGPSPAHERATEEIADHLHRRDLRAGRLPDERPRALSEALRLLETLEAQGLRVVFAGRG